ncbi:MAG: hypothetical protein E2O44_00410 [Nitrospina sp.]|nr:MAG: hypothetical protein E2O44_00410 [Nitrospina sp.]
MILTTWDPDPVGDGAEQAVRINGNDPIVTGSAHETQVRFLPPCNISLKKNGKCFKTSTTIAYFRHRETGKYFF